MKSTKKSLLLSTLSLIMCVAMLLGTTYAWFTDSVTSGKNQIIAGNLDVELYANGTKVDGDTKLFSDVALWEPGAVAFDTLQVKNVGNLALKYQLSFLFENEEKVDGHGLSEVLKIGTYAGEITDSTKREDVIAGLENVAPIASFAKSGNLAANTDDTAVTYVIYWKPGDNDNLFNMNNDNQGKTLSIDFWVKLVATQDTVEADSFNKLYDIDAPYLGGTDDAGLAANTKADTKTVEIQSAEQLTSFAKAVNAGTTYDKYTVKLMKNIDLNNVEWTQINGAGHDITFDGNNKTIKNLKVSNGHNAGFFATGSGCTIKNLTFENASVTGVGRGAVVVGHGMCTTVENCKVKDSTITAVVTKNDDGDKVGAIVGYLSGEPNASVTGCTVENVTVTGYRDIGALVGYAGGTYTVTGNTVKNCIVINDRTNNYKNYDEDAKFDVHEIIGEKGSAGTDENNTATSVKIFKLPIEGYEKTEDGAKVSTSQALEFSAATAKTGDTISLTQNLDGDVHFNVPEDVENLTVILNAHKVTNGKLYLHGSDKINLNLGTPGGPFVFDMTFIEFD